QLIREPSKLGFIALASHQLLIRNSAPSKFNTDKSAFDRSYGRKILLAGLDPTLLASELLDPTLRIQQLCEDGLRISRARRFARIRGRAGGCRASMRRCSTT